MKELTIRQTRCLQIIRDSVNQHGIAPTLREIGELMGIRSTNGVNDHLRALEKKGAIKRDSMKSRCIELVGSHRNSRKLTPRETEALDLLDITPFQRRRIEAIICE